MDRQEIFTWVLENYGTEPDYPWNDWNAVLRHDENGKWYGVIQEIPVTKLGLVGDRLVDVLNVKCDPIMVGSLRQQPGYYPAYHMNKDSWISIALDGTVPAEDIKHLIDLSFNLTRKKMKLQKRETAAMEICFIYPFPGPNIE